MPASIDGYRLDANIAEEHQLEADVTEHPVERGADMTDHIRTKQDVVTLESIVSNTPLGEVARLRALGALPTEDALALLRDIRKTKRIVTIDTTLGRYENMAMQSLHIPRNAGIGTHVLQFRAVFKQVAIRDNQRVFVKVDVPRAPKKNVGKKPPGEVKITDRRAEARARNARAAQAQKERCDRASISWRTAHC